MVDWRNWETLIHYKGALFDVIGLLSLLGYAIFGFNDVESLGVLGNSIGALLFILSFSLMWHYSKKPSAVQVWLDSLPDDGRDVFLNLPMSCRGIFFKVPNFDGNSQNFIEKMTALSSDTNNLSETKPDIVVTLMESTLNPHQFALVSNLFHHFPCLNPKMIQYLLRRCVCILLLAQRGNQNLLF